MMSAAGSPPPYRRASPQVGGPQQSGQQQSGPQRLSDEDTEELYENAPCGYLSTQLDGLIVRANRTLLSRLGRDRDEVVGRMRFADLLTVGGKLYHETHFAPLLHLQGEVSGVALELKAADGTRLPVLVTASVKTDSAGRPQLIRTTVNDARDRRSYETELLRSREKAERERERSQRLVSTLQQTLVPPVLASPPGLDVAAHYHIASPDEVSGDFYDLFPLARDTWGLFIGDVCGKGAPAAVLTSLARYTLRAATVYNPEPVAVLSNLNTVLNTADYEHDPRFCTVLFGVLHSEDEGFRVTLASGGHPHALLLRGSGTAEYIPTPGGQLIGVLANPTVATTSVRLEAGDTLLLYTDGLTEAHTATAGGDRYGEDALLAYTDVLAPCTAEQTVDAMAELLDAFGEGLVDDTAVLALGVPPHGAPG
ncbi:PP2C family protein-serine/threonine phosphatase [Streptomyces winkii]|uniref:PP2C family protein-serine/threonine phosphatase n=1 Tax=Streptomyces winkii TaxID=3051178 RepID=UPI0028D625EA|nr:SpoIIE family protein phosphatase [Streptomyces sp. DSM 40971]